MSWSLRHVDVVTPVQRPFGKSLQVRRVVRITGLMLLLSLTGFLFVLPVITVMMGVFYNTTSGSTAQWQVDGLVRTFADSRTYVALQNSLIYALATTAIGTSIGAAFAFLSARTNVPFRQLLSPVMLLVFAAPNLLYAVSWSLLADPGAGLLNEAIGLATASAIKPFNAYTWPGLVMVQGLKLAAFCYLLLIGPFQNMNRNYEEASLICGASRLSTLVRIDLPLMMPAVFGVIIISIVFGLSAFDIPQVLGGLADIPVLSTEIFRAVNFAIPPDYSRASSLGLFMMAALALLLLLQWRIVPPGRFVTVTGKSFNQERWELGRWNAAAGGAILVYIVATLILPGVQLVLTSFEPAIGVFNLTLGNYRSVLSDPQTGQAFRTTGILATLAGLIGVSLAAVIGYVGRHTSRALDRVLETATLTPLVLPGVVLAIGMLWLYVSIPGLRLLYATIWLTLLGLVVVVMPVASRSIRGALAQIAPELEEAASVSGASDFRVLVDIIIRLIGGSFVSGWLIAGVIAAGTLDVPLMLLPATRPNVAVLAYTDIFAALPTVASALLVLLLLAIMATALLYCAGRFAWRCVSTPRTRFGTVQ
jgi:iron(III) transport system permease protein